MSVWIREAGKLLRNSFSRSNGIHDATHSQVGDIFFQIIQSQTHSCTRFLHALLMGPQEAVQPIFVAKLFVKFGNVLIGLNALTKQSMAM